MVPRSGSLTVAELVRQLRVSQASIPRPWPSWRRKDSSGESASRREQYVLGADLWYRSLLATAQRNTALADGARRTVAILGSATPAGARLAVSLQWTVAVAHDLTGFAGGIGLAAAVGLASARIGHRPGRLTTALAALGQRSLTFYLFQSVVWLALFYPFTFNLRDEVSLAGSYGIATGVFAVSVLLAERMRRIGQRGPMEVLVRRMSYPRVTTRAGSPSQAR